MEARERQHRPGLIPEIESNGTTAPSGDRRRLVLWDVDGTLVSAGAVARRAFDLAVASVIGREAGDHGVVMSGKTDPQIALEILASLALADDDARRHLPQVLEGLERELEAAKDEIRAGGRVLPGVEQVLRRLDATPGVVQTLLTGNLAPNARLKVAAFGLDRWLDLDAGAYGSDDHDRTRLVPIALANARARHGDVFDPGDVWVVGDTPLDLACARAGGVRCLLVATGRIPFDELVAAGPDEVLRDLTDTTRVVRILAGADTDGPAAAPPRG